MGDVVKLDATSPTEEMRKRFETFVRSGTRTDEASRFLTRSRGGEYVMATTRAGWAAWQGAIFDLVELYKAETKKD